MLALSTAEGLELFDTAMIVSRPFLAPRPRPTSPHCEAHAVAVPPMFSDLASADRRRSTTPWPPQSRNRRASPARAARSRTAHRLARPGAFASPPCWATSRQNHRPRQSFRTWVLTRPRSEMRNRLKSRHRPFTHHAHLRLPDTQSAGLLYPHQRRPPTRIKLTPARYAATTRSDRDRGHGVPHPRRVNSPVKRH